MQILLSKKFLGTERDFIIDGEQGKWAASAERASYTFGDPTSVSAIEPLLRLYGLSIPELVPEKYIKAMDLCYSGQIPWRYSMPKKEYMRRFKKLVEDVRTLQETIENNQYSNFFLESNSVFAKLCNSHVDQGMISQLNSKNDVAALRSIEKMAKNSILPVPTYSRTATKTGRLTITAGPQLLTLKKDFRKVFKSSFQSGQLYEIDFISLEPRVALSVGDSAPENDDVYSHFIEKNKISITRDTAKLAVLCALYGAGSSRLDKVLKRDNENINARELLSRVSSFFGIPALASVLRQQAPSGYITSFFGRPINIDDGRQNVLVNNFIQSTAADLALLGFSKLVNLFPDGCKPVFIIHDALIIDVHPDVLQQVRDLTKSGFFHEQLGYFPLQFKRLK